MHPVLAADAGRDLSRFVQVFLARVHVELYLSRRTVHFHLLAARLIGERFVISLRPLYAVSLVEQGPQGEVVAGRIITPGVRAVRVLAETRGGKIAVLTEFPVGLNAGVRLALIFPPGAADIARLKSRYAESLRKIRIGKLFDFPLRPRIDGGRIGTAAGGDGQEKDRA